VYSRVSRNRKPECLILILWLAVISFLVRGWCGSFLSFHGASCSLWNEATKTWSSAPKIRHDKKGKQQRKKKKEIRWRVQLQSPIFLIRCGKNHVIYDDPAPLSSFQCPFSIQSLNLAHFDSILGPKKILWISPANLGKNPSHSQESLLSTLNIQMGISWAFDIEIKRFKSPNSSMCPRLQLWWGFKVR